MHVENFRGLVDERIEFDESMTVLAGGNGGGKSSLLEAISIMLSWLPAGLPSAERTPMKIRTSDITVGKSYSRLSMILGERRKPDISLARKMLNDWEPTIQLRDGLVKTIAYFEDILSRGSVRH